MSVTFENTVKNAKAIDLKPHEEMKKPTTAKKVIFNLEKISYHEPSENKTEE